MKTKQQNTSLNILLADDDKDDRLFFAKALKEISIATKLKTVPNGESLMEYLTENSEHLPDVLFLDLNMPRKNGAECLEEIRSKKKLQHLPIIIYSTSVNDTVADVLYQKGAHYYLRKRRLDDLAIILQHILGLMIENKFVRPTRGEFVLNQVKV